MVKEAGSLHRSSQKKKKDIGPRVLGTKKSAKEKTKGFMCFHIFNKVCNAGQGQFSSMQWKWKSIKEATIMFKELEKLP